MSLTPVPLPTPLRVARAIALVQGFVAGLGVALVLGIAVIAAGGLRNGAFVAFALLFLAGDVLALSAAVIHAARRLADGAGWARLLLDVVEGVTVAAGLLAIPMGASLMGIPAIAAGATVIVCLHLPSSRAVFASAPLLPWQAVDEPSDPPLPVPSLPPPRTRQATARRVAPPPALPLPAGRSTGRRPDLPVPSPAARMVPPAAAREEAPVAPPPVLPLLGERSTAGRPAAPLASPAARVGPPAAEPPEGPVRPSPVLPFPAARWTAPSPHAAVPSLAAPVEPPAARPERAMVPPPPASRWAAQPPDVAVPSVPTPGPAASRWAAPPPDAVVPSAPTPPPPAAALPPPAPTRRPAVEAAPPAGLPRTPPLAPPWSGRPIRAASMTATTAGDRQVVRGPAAATPAPPQRALPPAPTWGWRRVVIGASVLGAVAGGAASIAGLLTGGGRLPSTGVTPAGPPPRSGALPGAPAPGSAAPPPVRVEPAAAGGVEAVGISPAGGCVPGATCTVTVRVDLQPHSDEVVNWVLVVVDRCTAQRIETTVPGIPAAASYRYVLSTNAVVIPPWRAPQVVAMTTSPARAASAALTVGGASGC